MEILKKKTIRKRIKNIRIKNKKYYIIIYKQESNQIIELLNNENTTFKNISYKSVNRTKLNNMNNNSFSNNRIRFNTKEISNHLVSYEDAYIL